MTRRKSPSNPHPRARPKRSRPRSRTISVKKMLSERRAAARVANPSIGLKGPIAPVIAVLGDGLTSEDRELLAARPRTRGECSNGLRPCPWVGCQYHLFLDVNPETGAIKLNFPELKPEDLAESCALDVADAGWHTLEEVGGLTNVTRERLRQLEIKGLIALRALSDSLR